MSTSRFLFQSVKPRFNNKQTKIKLLFDVVDYIIALVELDFALYAKFAECFLQYLALLGRKHFAVISNALYISFSEDTTYRRTKIIPVSHENVQAPEAIFEKRPL